MVAASVGVDLVGPTKLSSDNNQSFVKFADCLKAVDQSGHRIIQSPCGVLERCLDVLVVITSATGDTDGSNTFLDEASSKQSALAHATHAEFLALGIALLTQVEDVKVIALQERHGVVIIFAVSLHFVGRKLGLESIPGAPDFNLVTEALGQRVMHPPTVAGWAQGRSWITPGLLLERGNFALDVMFADLSFIPEDRYPVYAGGSEILAVDARVRSGYDLTTATKPAGMGSGDMMAMSNVMADRDEAFNTRFASYRGWQMAIERVKPIERQLAAIDLTAMVTDAGLKTPDAVVEYFAARFLSVPLDEVTHTSFARFLEQQLGTADIPAAQTYMEDPLRILLHMILSRPEYQLG